MHLRTKMIITLVVLTIAMCSTYTALAIRSTNRQMAADSYVSSIGQYLQDGVKTSGPVVEMGNDLGPQWRLLTDAEYRKLADSMSRDDRVEGRVARNSADTGRSGVTSLRSTRLVLSDSWGRQILIAGRKDIGKSAEFVVWSKGRDGVFGTSDDISSPLGADIPDGLVR